jgi:DHA2 family multidrug resistance protein
VNPQLLIILGVAAFSTSAWMMAHYTLDTNSNGVVAALLVQGVGFAMLMVPLNTLALANIPRHKMTDATGLNSLMRQIGGSIGLAVFATLLSRFGVAGRAAVGNHLVTSNADVLTRMAALRAGMVARGFDSTTAEGMATQLMAGLVARQGMVLAFEKIFLLAGICFLVVLPLVYFLRRPGATAPAKAAELHVEM